MEAIRDKLRAGQDSTWDRCQQNRLPRVLVLDDDPLFCQIFRKLAKKRQIAITCARPDAFFETLPTDGYFDVVIVDYDLGDMSGVEIAKLFKSTPVILVSASDDISVDGNPVIRQFVSKKQGLNHLLEAALCFCRASGADQMTAAVSSDAKTHF